MGIPIWRQVIRCEFKRINGSNAKDMLIECFRALKLGSIANDLRGMALYGWMPLDKYFDFSLHETKQSTNECDMMHSDHASAQTLKIDNNHVMRDFLCVLNILNDKWKQQKQKLFVHISSNLRWFVDHLILRQQDIGMCCSLRRKRKAIYHCEKGFCDCVAVKISAIFSHFVRIMRTKFYSFIITINDDHQHYVRSHLNGVHAFVLQWQLKCDWNKYAHDACGTYTQKCLFPTCESRENIKIATTTIKTKQ